MAKKNRINLSYVGENIQKIRQAKKLSQAEFAKIFDLARASVGAYEEGRSEPKIDTLIAMANHFGISVDDLLTRKLTVSEIFNVDELNEKLDRVHQLKSSDREQVETIKLIAIADHVEFILSGLSKSFTNRLRSIGNYYQSKIVAALETNGNEMLVNGNGIRHGDVLFLKPITTVELPSKIGRVLVIRTDKQLMVRRLHQHEHTSIELKADDTNFDNVIIESKDVLDFFEVVAISSQYIPKPTTTEDRLKKIEEELRRLGK